ncbi:MAG TPA: ABC transporter ATP-binding protein, partial [Ignavibacteria bacterium]|nr:ABC transporter ATP-binding protein [Ignavibacteria bacterium]
MKRLVEVFDSNPAIVDPDILEVDKESLAGAKDPIKGEIEFRNVNFRYHPNYPYVLKNINIRLKAGETIGVI